MKEIKTEITIQSTPEKVWEILTDFEKHPNWNPFIKEISGSKKIGERMLVKIQNPDGGGMTFKPLLLKFEENREFRWIGSLLVKGIFDGEHFFELLDNQNGTTTFIHGEKFKGLLVPFTGKSLEGTKSGFEAMNKAIKKEVEKTRT